MSIMKSRMHFLTPQTHLDIGISPSFNFGIVLQVFPLGDQFVFVECLVAKLKSSMYMTL